MRKNQEHTGIIIQARVGSTRLKNKMIKPFYQGKSILEILLERFEKEIVEDIPFVIATTMNQNDNAIAALAKSKQVPFFRGSENDVLQRFIDTAKYFGFEKIVRICADNPLLDIQGTLQLYDLKLSNNWDYLAYRVVGNKPSILSHLGFWGEWVTLNAFEKIRTATNEKVYHEHVTNYLYLHPELFKTELHDAPALVFKRDDIRLTVDRQEDFDIVAGIYEKLKSLSLPLTIVNIINVVDNHPEYLVRMAKQITLNKK